MNAKAERQQAELEWLMRTDVEATRGCDDELDVFCAQRGIDTADEREMAGARKILETARAIGIEVTPVVSDRAPARADDQPPIFEDVSTATNINSAPTPPRSR